MYWFHIAKLLPFLSPCNPCGRVKKRCAHTEFSVSGVWDAGYFRFCTENTIFAQTAVAGFVQCLLELLHIIAPATFLDCSHIIQF